MYLLLLLAPAIARSLSTQSYTIMPHYNWNGLLNFIALRNAPEAPKMSRFRTEHIIPAKFAGLKPLPIRIKKALFTAEIGLSILDLSAHVK